MLIKEIFEKKNRVLLKELVKTDFKLRYQGSAIGYLWSILKPLMLFAVMYVIFVRFLRFGGDIPNFALALLLGTVLWTFFLEVTNQGMHVIVDRGDLLRKISFPKYIIVLSVVINALINLGINLVIVLVFCLFNKIVFSWSLIFIPLLIGELLIFSLGVAFFLSTAYVYFRDIGQIWEVLMQFLFYATPIIYPLNMVVDRNHHLAAKLMLINPLAQIIQDMRKILIWDSYSQAITGWNYLNNILVKFVPILLVAVIFVIGSLIFSRSSKRFAEIL
jgi:ABC-2 type transport system permease protein